MFQRFVVCIGALCCLASQLSAQQRVPGPDLVQSRILILLDESSSMIDKWGDSSTKKYLAAHEIIMRIMDSVYSYNKDVEFSLRVFGHQHTVKENNCFDTRNEVSFSKSNKVQMDLRLSDIHPLGVTPIAYALKQAAENDLLDEVHNAYSLILITDGGESCGGDLCEVMRTLVASKVFFRPYIVGLEDAPELKATYNCMGDYLSMTHPDDIAPGVSKIVTAFKPIIKVTKSEFKEMKLNGFTAPSILKVSPPAPKSEPTVPARPTVPHTALINHLNCANLMPVSLPEPDKLRVPKILVPPAPEIGVDIPHVDKIEHVLPAGMIEMMGATLIPVKVPWYEPPVVDMPQIVIPHVPDINHIEMAPMVTLSGAAPVAKNIAKYLPPPVDEIVTLPPVSLIDHIGKSPTHDLTLTPKTFRPATKPAPHVEDSVWQHGNTTDKSQDNSQRDMVLTVKKFKSDTKAPPPAEKPVIPDVNSIEHIRHAPMLDLNLNTKTFVPQKRTVPATDVKEQATLPPTTAIQHIKPAAIRLMEQPIASTGPLKMAKPPAPPVEPRETPEIPSVAKINRIIPAKPAFANITPVIPIPLKMVNASVPGVDYVEKPDITGTHKIPRQRPAHMIEPKLVFLIEDHVLKLHTPPDPPTFAPIVPIPSPALLASKPNLGPAPPAKPASEKGINSTYTLETIDAKETGVMIYFTNGHGKYYQSTPVVLMLEPFSNKVAKKFYRTVDGAGIPDIQKDVPPGTYNIAIGDVRNLNLHDVEIVEKKLNKIVVKLKNSSLAFAYDGAPSRSVSEFIATVTERNVPNGKVIDQKCTQKLEYEPGNYHVEIHTYPPEVRNLDLDFDATKVINIAQPGFVKFTTDMKGRKLNLFKPVNDKYLQFDSRNSSDTSLQHLQIQPGQYQVRYLKDPTRPYAKETILSFAVKSNEVTEVVLPSK